MIREMLLKTLLLWGLLAASFSAVAAQDVYSEGEIKQARRHYERAGKLYRKGRCGQAIEELDEALIFREIYPEAEWLLARALVKAERPREAFGMLRSINVSHQESAEFWKLSGQVFLLMNKTAKPRKRCCEPSAGPRALTPSCAITSAWSDFVRERVKTRSTKRSRRSESTRASPRLVGCSATRLWFSVTTSEPSANCRSICRTPPSGLKPRIFGGVSPPFAPWRRREAQIHHSRRLAFVTSRSLITLMRPAAAKSRGR